MRVTTTSYVAEYLGTFFFILSVFASGGNPLIIGGALALVVFLIGAHSGSHVNPAISLAMLLNGELNTTEAIGYTVAQLAGGVSAFYAYRIL
jgi:aquaporin Z